jgi:hypothetical protein
LAFNETLSRKEMHMTRRWITYWTATLLLSALGGCDTLNQAQFQIPDSSGDAAHRDRVVAIVQDAAINAGMVDRTGISKAANTLVYFEEPVKNFRTTLGARSAGEYLVIDLACFHAGGGSETPTFSVTKTFLENSLKAELGQNWRLVTDRAEWIPVTKNAP